MFREAAGLRGEQATVHNLKIRGDRRTKIHMRQDVALKIDTGAISVSTGPSGRSSKTARSVT